MILAWSHLIVALVVAVGTIIPDGQMDHPPPLDSRAVAGLARLESVVSASPESFRDAAEYRRLVIATWQHDRAYTFFDRLIRAHPSSVGLRLSAALARVDQLPRVPTRGQIALGRRIVDLATQAISLRPTWAAFLMRGRVYMGLRVVADTGGKALADLERARQLQRAAPTCAMQVQVFATLGDAYWMLGRTDDARRVWQDGRAIFPDAPDLRERLLSNDKALKALTVRTFNPWKRADTGTSLTSPCESLYDF